MAYCVARRTPSTMPSMPCVGTATSSRHDAPKTAGRLRSPHASPPRASSGPVSTSCSTNSSAQATASMPAKRETRSSGPTLSARTTCALNM
jgi:hypothetical protein